MTTPAVMGAVTIRRPGGSMDTGEPLPAVDHDLPGCSWWPTTSDELTDHRHTVIAGYMLTCQDRDADVKSTDKVILPGVTDDSGDPAVWEVDGQIGRWGEPNGFQLGTGGLQVALRRASG